MIGIVNSIKIMDEINKLLIKEFPKSMVYIDLRPKDFKRPSFLIELVTVSQDPVNTKLIQETDYFTITCFDKTDNYLNTSTVGLLNIQQTVMDIFKKGFIITGDRAIKVKASTGGRDFDKAYIDLQFEYFENRSDDTDNTPKIKEVQVTLEEE